MYRVQILRRMYRGLILHVRRMYRGQLFQMKYRGQKITCERNV